MLICSICLTTDSLALYEANKNEAAEMLLVSLTQWGWSTYQHWFTNPYLAILEKRHITPLIRGRVAPLLIVEARRGDRITQYVLGELSHTLDDLWWIFRWKGHRQLIFYVATIAALRKAGDRKTGLLLSNPKSSRSRSLGPIYVVNCFFQITISNIGKQLFPRNFRWVNVCSAYLSTNSVRSFSRVTQSA